MRTTINGVDGVRKRENVFAVGVVVLQRDFDFDRAALSFDVDGRIVQRRLSALQMLDEFGHAAGKPKLRPLLRALVAARDFRALVQESQFAMSLLHSVLPE